MAHLVDRIVDRRIFRNVRIALRNVGFRLIVIVVTDEIFDSIVREKLFEFLIELPASVLLCARTSVGFCTCSITLAMVKVLPDP